MCPVELLTFITNYSLMLVSSGLVLLLAAAIGTRTAISRAADCIILAGMILFPPGLPHLLLAYFKNNEFNPMSEHSSFEKLVLP